MPPEKKIMFQARLQRRLREMNIHSFEEYSKKLMDGNGEGSEINMIADYISTNKTEFFRENEHFKYLSDQILPEYITKQIKLHQPHLNIWSAGCSSGQEAYSIGITLEEFKRMKNINFNYSILATDISNRMLKLAKEAIYPMSQAEAISTEIKKRYFLKSKSLKESKVKISKEIREKIRVAYMNLMDANYPFENKFDIIFLRNTLIYFDSDIQLKVLSKVIGCLNEGGYLFIGHSESLINLSLPIQSVAPCVYIKLNTK